MSESPRPAAKGGRPRSERLHKAILKTALDLVLEEGFRAVSTEAIAARTGVGKTTIYRRWPNKAAVIMEAFIDQLSSASSFPTAETALESIRLQMHATGKAFRGRDGALVKALLAEAQFDPELAKTFREDWTLPRRKRALAAVHEAISQGDLRADIDVETTVDLLYAPMYYRLQIGTGPISDAYIDRVFHHAMHGLRKARS